MQASTCRSPITTTCNWTNSIYTCCCKGWKWLCRDRSCKHNCIIYTKLTNNSTTEIPEPSIISNLESHYSGELPEYVSNSQIAYDIASDKVMPPTTWTKLGNGHNNQQWLFFYSWNTCSWTNRSWTNCFWIECIWTYHKQPINNNQHSWNWNLHKWPTLITKPSYTTCSRSQNKCPFSTYIIPTFNYSWKCMW